MKYDVLACGGEEVALPDSPSYVPLNPLLKHVCIFYTYVSVLSTIYHMSPGLVDVSVTGGIERGGKCADWAGLSYQNQWRSPYMYVYARMYSSHWLSRLGIVRTSIPVRTFGLTYINFRPARECSAGVPVRGSRSLCSHMHEDKTGRRSIA
jgi:hypothetical protein